MRRGGSGGSSYPRRSGHRARATSITIVGLPDVAAQESRERVRAAIRNTDLSFAQSRLTINLAPADVRKEGPAYDLPIALGILLASEQIFADLEGTIVMGELSLDGSVRHVLGVLPMAVMAREQGYRALYVPDEDAAEASLIGALEVYPVPNFLALTDHVTGHARLSPYQRQFSLDSEDDLPPYAADLSEIKG